MLIQPACVQRMNGKAVALGHAGLSRFEELSHREAADTAILCCQELTQDQPERLPFIHERPNDLSGTVSEKLRPWAEFSLRQRD
jgi:hypothetical protein